MEEARWGVVCPGTFTEVAHDWRQALMFQGKAAHISRHLPRPEHACAATRQEALLACSLLLSFLRRRHVHCCGTLWCTWVYHLEPSDAWGRKALFEACATPHSIVSGRLVSVQLLKTVGELSIDASSQREHHGTKVLEMRLFQQTEFFCGVMGSFEAILCSSWFLAYIYIKIRAIPIMLLFYSQFKDRTCWNILWFRFSLVHTIRSFGISVNKDGIFWLSSEKVK